MQGHLGSGRRYVQKNVKNKRKEYSGQCAQGKSMNVKQVEEHGEQDRKENTMHLWEYITPGVLCCSSDR